MTKKKKKKKKKRKKKKTERKILVGCGVAALAVSATQGAVTSPEAGASLESLTLQKIHFHLFIHRFIPPSIHVSILSI
jgi:hypothetical protein